MDNLDNNEDTLADVLQLILDSDTELNMTEFYLIRLIVENKCPGFKVVEVE